MLCVALAGDVMRAWFIHQAFSDYQLQQMTSNFIDQFGFNEEEFGEQEEKTEWVNLRFFMHAELYLCIYCTELS